MNALLLATVCTDDNGVTETTAGVVFLLVSGARFGSRFGPETPEDRTGAGRKPVFCPTIPSEVVGNEDDVGNIVVGNEDGNTDVAGTDDVGNTDADRDIVIDCATLWIGGKGSLLYIGNAESWLPTPELCEISEGELNSLLIECSGYFAK